MSTRDPLGRAVQILRFIGESPDGVVGIRQLAKSLEMEPSTMSRAIAALRQHGMVRDVPGGRLKLGLELMRLGRLAYDQIDLRAVARPHIEQLSRSHDESVYVTLFDQDRRQLIQIDTVASTRPLRYSAALDEWTDLHRGAVGLAILAHLPDSDHRRVIDDLAGSPSRRVLRGEALARELVAIRVRRYACTHGHRVDGVVGIASAFFDVSGKVRGDVVLIVPEVRFPEDGESLFAPLVVETADKITSALGGTPRAEAESGASVGTGRSPDRAAETTAHPAGGYHDAPPSDRSCADRQDQRRPITPTIPSRSGL